MSFDYRDETHSYPSVATLTKTLYGRSYLFLVNSSEQTVSVDIGGIPGSSPVVDYLSDTPVDAAALSGLVLPPYAFRTFTWTP